MVFGVSCILLQYKFKLLELDWLFKNVLDAQTGKVSFELDRAEGGKENVNRLFKFQLGINLELGRVKIAHLL